MCNKAHSLPRCQQPRRCSTVSVPRAFTVPAEQCLSPCHVHHLLSGTPRAQATRGERGRCAVSRPLSPDKLHPVSPLALRSSVPLPGVSKRGSEEAMAVFVALSASRVHTVARVAAAPHRGLAPLTGWAPPLVSEAALPAAWAWSFELLSAL
uniref:Uncharacterized protein n=1 Tax=Rousettus aegyptiacus TaxID=9407 RepID=A0A7J8E7Y3_ROUAE|nr:hypothetical protein HJG63_008090 [Rousettus aegyptiacus]